MSLLLDALKKAADDKKKTTDVPVNISHAKDSLADDSLELDLHTTDDSSDIQADDAPELDDSALYKTDEIDVLSSELPLDNSSFADKKEAQKHESSINPQSETIEANETSSKDNVEQGSKNVNSNSIDLVTHSFNTTNNKKVHTDTIDNSKSDSGNLSIQSLSSNVSSSASSKSTINTEHALSALINKSHSYRKNQNKRQFISLALLFSLILIGTALYFYIQIDTSRQTIYQQDNNFSNVAPEKLVKISKLNNQLKDHNLELANESTSPVTEKHSSIHQADKSQTDTIKPITDTKVTKKSYVPEKSSISSTEISIVKSTRPDPVHILLQQAYDQFSNTNYQQSQSLYNKVLKQEPRNRDALLGIAAIATKQQRYEFARQKYQFLLKLNPRDSFALAGLSSIHNHLNPQLSESQLKFMLKQQPDAAHLYFALGTLYSSQNKWPQAQSAYFSAWSAESKNADYAYNLAVSLDHLNKHEQAIKFYQLSLSLLDKTNSNFSAESAKQRIHLLQADIQ